MRLVFTNELRRDKAICIEKGISNDVGGVFAVGYFPGTGEIGEKELFMEGMGD